LDRVEEQSAVTGTLQVREAIPSLSPAGEVAAFRIVKEAIANAVQHGHPTKIAVTAARDGSGLRLEVRDDGAGFDRTAPGRVDSFGITSMVERAASCGGALELISRPGGGTSVILRLPAVEPAPSEVMG
jgi:signal transduction histidine kinase